MVVTLAAVRTRVALAEDDALLREGLVSLLERSGLVVVGEGGDAEQSLALAREHRPDLAVVDARMPLLASGHSSGYLLKTRVTDVADFIDTPAGRVKWLGRHSHEAAAPRTDGVHRRVLVVLAFLDALAG